MKRCCNIAFCLVFMVTAMAQENTGLKIIFKPFFGSSRLSLDSIYRVNTQDSIQFNNFKFYVSKVELLNTGKSIFKDEQLAHLIDASIKDAQEILLNVSANLHFDQVRFSIGIDSVTNVAGVLGGDLDPTTGMYWSWQSGYINMKLEGKSNMSSDRKSEFAFHLGGYQFPNIGIQTINLNVSDASDMEIDIDLKFFINQLNLSQQHHIMSPSIKAVTLSQLFSQSFKLSEKR